MMTTKRSRRWNSTESSSSVKMAPSKGLKDPLALGDHLVRLRIDAHDGASAGDPEPARCDRNVLRECHRNRRDDLPRLHIEPIYLVARTQAVVATCADQEALAGQIEPGRAARHPGVVVRMTAETVWAGASTTVA